MGYFLSHEFARADDVLDVWVVALEGGQVHPQLGRVEAGRITHLDFWSGENGSKLQFLIFKNFSLENGNVAISLFSFPFPF